LGFLTYLQIDDTGKLITVRVNEPGLSATTTLKVADFGYLKFIGLKRFVSGKWISIIDVRYLTYFDIFTLNPFPYARDIKLHDERDIPPGDPNIQRAINTELEHLKKEHCLDLKSFLDLAFHDIIEKEKVPLVLRLAREIELASLS